MNEKFFSLPEERQRAMLNAGYRVFARNSYKKSPMSEIADAAGISKALLFHYFGNKKGLYLFLWEHCAQVTLQKLAAVLLEVLVMNAVLLAVSLVCIAGIGEEIPYAQLLRLHGAYLLMQAELACLCFGLSAFVIRGSAGAGLGIALMAYFLHLAANIAQSAHALRYVTPFAYAEGAEILERGQLDGGLILLGAVYALAAVAAGIRHYAHKDIQ